MPRVIILHAPDEESIAEKLAEPIQGWGYEVWHTGNVLVGDHIVKELSDRLADNGPVVINGTTRAAGSKWLRTILSHLQDHHYAKRVFPVRVEVDADLERVCLGTKIAECAPNFSEGLRQLKEALERNFPNGLTAESIEVLSGKYQEDFDSWLTNYTSFSQSLLHEYRSILRPEIRESKLGDGLDSLTFLAQANLLTNGRLYAAGVLLFTDCPDKLIPSAFVQCVRYQGTSRDSGQDQRDLYGPISKQIHDTILFTSNRTEKIEITEPGEAAAKLVYRFPMVCLREVVANALCHRDYSLRDRHVHVRIFSNRIEVLSPGEWRGAEWLHTAECSLVELESESVTKNERLASALRWIKLVETQGSGIPNAIADCRETDAPLPVVTTKDGFVRVTVFPRNNWDAEAIGRRSQMASVGSAPEPKIDRLGPTLDFGRLPIPGPHFVGREIEIARLDAAWEDPTIRVLTLVAFGGVGKSTLVARWMDHMAADGWRGAARVLDWSFYSQGSKDQNTSAEPFIDHALRFFGDPDPKAGALHDRGARLASLIRKERTLLVLDGIEPLQYPPGRPEIEGRFKDPGLAALLKGLAAGNPGLCLVTTRERIADLTGLPSTAPQILLEELEPGAAVALLRQLGVNGRETELIAAAKEYQRHALTLTLLGNFLRRAHGGDIRKQREIDLHRADEKQGGHAFRVIAAYARWLGEGPELAILRLLGLFDRPADADTLKTLSAAPPIPGLTEPLVGLSNEDWHLATATLREHGLVLAADPWDPEPLDAHPLVRSCFAEELESHRPDAWQEGNRRLYEHLRQAAPDLPDTLEAMQPLYAAVVHGCRAGRHQEVMEEIYWRRIQRGEEFFSSKKLGAFGSELEALASFFDRPWSKPSIRLTAADQEFALNQAAFYLRALGRLAEAVEPMQAGLEAARQRNDWAFAAAVASNLSELTLTMGDVPRAMAFGEQSVELADRSGDAFERPRDRTTWADALHQANLLEESAAAFREAEAMQVERHPEYSSLDSLPGFQYCALLLGRAEPEAGSGLDGLAGSGCRPEETKFFRQACREVLDRAKSLPSDPLLDIALDFALDHLSLGCAHLGLALTDPGEGRTAGLAHATELLDQAVDGLRRAGREDYLPRGLLARAALRRFLFDFPGASEDLTEALEIAERGPMQLHECDAHLEWARLCRDQGNLIAARQHVVRARELVNETGYGRREREVRWLEGTLAGG